jgi:hypothetical protein
VLVHTDYYYYLTIVHKDTLIQLNINILSQRIQHSCKMSNTTSMGPSLAAATAVTARLVTRVQNVTVDHVHAAVIHAIV